MTLDHPAKELAKMILPRRVFASIASIRSRQHQRYLLKHNGHIDALYALTQRYGYRVLHGPFQGMTYPPEALLTRSGIPLLLGTYESELHSIIKSIRPGQYDCIIDVGCAEGYYAVGLARLTDARVYGFDTEYRERAFCRRMACLNGVRDRVIVGGWCDKPMLRRTAIGRCLVICDCEGYETELFMPDSICMLSHSDLIIELHERPESRYTEETILRRFLPSHRAELLTFSPAEFDRSFVCELASVQGELRFVREQRPVDQRWVYLTARI